MRRVFVGTLITVMALTMILVLHDIEDLRQSIAGVRHDLVMFAACDREGAVVLSGRIDNVVSRIPDWEKLRRLQEHSTVQVMSGGGHGSGVILKDGFVLTAGHCTGHGDITVKTRDGELYPVTHVYDHPTYDLAILVVEGLHGDDLVLASEQKVQTLDTVFLLGSPLDKMYIGHATQGLLVTKDHGFSAFPHWPEGGLWRHSAPHAGGNSGGPVVTIDGKLLGIHVAGPGIGGVTAHGMFEPVTHVLETISDYERAR
jgi:S1-C subfamily serine protease